MTGNARTEPSTVGFPTVTWVEPSTRVRPGATLVLSCCSPIWVTELVSTAVTLPVAGMPNSNDATSWSTSVDGSTVGTGGLIDLVGGKRVVPGVLDRLASWPSDCLLSGLV